DFSPRRHEGYEEILLQGACFMPEGSKARRQGSRGTKLHQEYHFSFSTGFLRALRVFVVNGFYASFSSGFSSFQIVSSISGWLAAVGCRRSGWKASARRAKPSKRKGTSAVLCSLA